MTDTEPGTSTLTLGGKTIGRLCPPCTAEARALEAEARALEAEARDAAMDYHHAEAS